MNISLSHIVIIYALALLIFTILFIIDYCKEKKRKEQITIQALLQRPDGLNESLGYDLPSQIDEFIKFINTFSKLKGYTIKLSIFSALETIAKLKSELK